MTHKYNAASGGDFSNSSTVQRDSEKLWYHFVKYSPNSIFSSVNSSIGPDSSALPQLPRPDKVIDSQPHLPYLIHQHIVDLLALDTKVPHGNGRAAVIVPFSDDLKTYSVGVWYKGQLFYFLPECFCRCRIPRTELPVNGFPLAAVYPWLFSWAATSS